MPAKHPYIAATGAVGQLLSQLRKNLPSTVDASTLKKYNIAPNNESYLINILKFVGVIDEKGQVSSEAKAVFLKHDDEEFATAMADFVQSGYSDLFDLYGGDAWVLPTDKLISFFRQSDETSDVIGTRQARTFAVLAQAVGKRNGAVVSSKKVAAPKAPPPKSTAKFTPKAKTEVKTKEEIPDHASPLAALTVRIEVNLPSGGDQATYDAIFKSIRANLMQ